jgi:lipopolysaccharide export system permease protein
VPILQILKLFSLILPTFLEMTVPMAFLLAILLGLGRMSNDQELLAMKASGISAAQILWPVAALASVIALITFFLTMFARPVANFALKKELYNIAKNRVGTALKEKVFNDDFPKILIYVEEIVPPGNTAQGVLIVDKRDPIREDIILGKVARISTEEETNTLGLRLFDGSIYEREKNRPGFSQTRFNIYDFKLDLDDLIGPIQQKESGPKEMTISELLSSIEKKQREGAKTIAERMELHQRISFGFAPLLFCLGSRPHSGSTLFSRQSLLGIYVVPFLAGGLLCPAFARKGFRRQKYSSSHSCSLAAERCSWCDRSAFLQTCLARVASEFSPSA